MMEINITPSSKTKLYLKKKQEDVMIKIFKLKKKKKRIKALYIIMIVGSITTSAIAASLSGIVGLPIMIIPILTLSSGILTGLSFKFNLKDKKNELMKLVNQLEKINAKIEYIIENNGHTTEEDFNEIIKIF
jgi:hypothetical protein